LAAGANSGVVTSKTGKVLVLKGNTHKEKARKTEFTENEDGSLSEVRILTDRFVPVILAWDLTPGSEHLGKIMRISSSPAVEADPQAPESSPADEVQALRLAAESARFPTGHLMFTCGVQAAVADGLFNPATYIRRHFAGDWGELDESDRRMNETALHNGDRLFSSYDIDAGSETRLWIITEADRSVTTLLFPSEY
jgi:hypothetical protein